LERDPLKLCKEYILKNAVADTETLGKIEQDVVHRIEQAVEYAKSSPDPKPEDALQDVYYSQKP
jgi:TPP-dependent pyruvate/acetoin dehydrogenase alpha subunit